MLKDIRVLEIAQGLAGPVAGLMLAELGADVLKVEPPEGDPGRADASFASWNRSKRSTRMDLDSHTGQASLRELLAGADGTVNTSLLQGLLAPMSLVWSRVEKGPFSVRMPKPPRPNQTQMFQCGGGEWIQIMDPTGKLDFAALPLMWEVMAELNLAIDNIGEVRKAFAARPRDAWLDQLRAADVAVEPSTPLGEVLRHPEAIANGYVVEVDDPVWGRTWQAAVPLQLSEPVKVRGAAPKPGEGGDAAWPRRTVARPAAAASDHPLSGLKVVDLGAFLAGPMAPSMLGDLGADVIKVEPIGGDRMRFMARYFHAPARNKRSIAVDLARPEGQEILERLVKWADVAHHNMRLRAAAKIGVDEPGLRRHNPDLVYAYVSAYGQKGERGNWPGYDSIFQAIAGWEVENAGAGNPPIFSRAGTMDVLCAMSSLVGTLAGIYAHGQDGRAVSVEGSLLGVSCFTQGETLIRPDGELAPFPHLDPAQTGVSPLHRIYEAADGWVAVAAMAPGQDKALCSAFGATSIDGLEVAARGQPISGLMARLAAAQVPAEVVLRDVLDHLFDDPAHKATQAIVAYQHAECGQIEHPGAFWSFNDAQLRLADPLPPPLLGEHTDQILSELGYTADEVARLRHDGVIAG